MKQKEKNLPKEIHQGLRLFNQEDFYEAHEEFETAWQKTKGSSREFYRALIHISGGFYRLTQNRPKAAIKFFEHALKWLALFPDFHLGFDTALLKKDLQIIITAIEQGQVEVNEIKGLLNPIVLQETKK